MRIAASNLQDSNEPALLKLVARGDRCAFETLYLHYHRRLTRFLMRIAPRYDFAEEVINDTFWIVWQQAGQFRGASRVSTWIMGIAYRRAMQALRAARAGSHSDIDVALAADHAHDEPTQTAETQDWIAQGLQLLPTEQRMTMELAYYLGHSCDEIGQIMECPVTTVKARMFHAREKLRQSLPQLAEGIYS